MIISYQQPWFTPLPSLLPSAYSNERATTGNKKLLDVLSIDWSWIQHA